MSAPSPLFVHLAGMMQTARDRLEAVDRSQCGDEASRVWCRQRNGLMAAIVVEPPVTVADATIVMATLAEWRDLLLNDGDDLSARDRRDLEEVRTTALANCVICIAAAAPTDAPNTVDHLETIGWLERQTERWLPQRDRVPA